MSAPKGLAILGSTLALLLSVGSAMGANMWTDTLSGADLVKTGAAWLNPSLTWTVDFGVTTPGKWHYEYTLNVGGPQGNISHTGLSASLLCPLDVVVPQMRSAGTDVRCP